MKTWSVCAILLLIVAYIPHPIDSVYAQPKGKDREKLATALKAAETKAYAEVVKALEAHAKWATSMQAFEEARQQWRLIAVIKRDPKSVEKSYAALAGKADNPKDKYQQEAESQRQKLSSAAAKALLDFVSEARKKDGEDFALEAGVLWQMFFRDDAKAEERGLIWSEIAGALVLKEDATRFESGELRHNGEWLDKPALERANAAHASMGAAWELTDGFYSLTTNIDLSRARHLLSYCTRFRLLCYSQFCMDMGLRWPGGKLPVFMTTVRKEYNAICLKFDSSYSPGTEFGSYLHVMKKPFGPLAGCLEKPWGDKIYKLAPQYVLQGMNHELAHQLFFEALRWNEGSNIREANYWAGEGIACHMEAWFWLEGGWKLKPLHNYPQTEQGNQATARCLQARAMKERLRPLATFVAESYPAFSQDLDVSYAQAGALTTFLLDGKRPAYRIKFLSLLVEVHSCRDDAASFKKFFKEDDLGKLHSEFLEYLEGLSEEE